MPLHNLDGIVCFGRVGFSSPLAAACAEANVTLSLLSAQGRFHAAVVGFSPGNVLLRRQQYRAADEPTATAAIARPIVAAKIANARSVLLRGARESNCSETADRLRQVARRMVPILDVSRTCPDIDTLRGHEGEAASRYFAAFSDLLTAQREPFAFTERSRRPPLDRINALLSFLYALLSHDVRSACEATGLDAAVGFLHRDRPGRPGLALDLMEEFRPFLADRLALSLINRRQVAATGFTTTESGAVRMGTTGPVRPSWSPTNSGNATPSNIPSSARRQPWDCSSISRRGCWLGTSGATSMNILPLCGADGASDARAGHL